MKKKAVKLLSAALSIAIILGVSGTALAIEANTCFEIAVIKDGVEAAVLDVGDTIEVSINIVNTSDREMKYAATQCGIQYDTDYFAISGEPVSPIGGTAVSKPNEGTVRMGRFGVELSLVDGYSTILTFALIVKEVPAGATAISLSGGIIGDFHGLPILENATASTGLTITNPAPSPEPDTVTVTTADELNAAVYGVVDTGKSLEIRVEGTVPVDELYIQGCSITLTGGGTLERKSTESALITVLTVARESSSLTLRDITLDGKGLVAQGEGAVNAAMVLVHDGGALVIEDGTILENNHCGSAVLAEGGATVTMTGGTIRNNIAPQGAGLHIAAATAVMSGGTISGNTAAPAGMGGGVYVGGTNGSFRMEGGVISGNTALKELVEGQGGGVYVDTNATFTMTSGEIKNNVSQDSALTGIGVYNLGTFTMSGGMISGNVPGEAPAGARAIVGMGGGVYTRATLP